MKRVLYGALMLAFASPAMAQSIPGPTFDPRDMLERVLPGVVTVAVKTTQTTTAFGFADSKSPTTMKALQAYSAPLNLSGFEGGSGSGFVIERGGTRYVVTNAHVVEHAADGSIVAFSINRTPYRMRLVGADTYRDVAVLAFVDAPRAEIATVTLNANDDVRIGTPVYAVGNPMGQFPYTITAGVVSGLNRRVMMDLSGRTDVPIGDQGYIQTDATVSWGNSGGPLFGPNGMVLGINSAIYLTDVLGAAIPLSQINFSLEGRHVTRVVDDIVRYGRVRRAYVGIILASPNNPDDPTATGPVTVGAALMTGHPLTAHAGSRVISMNGTRITTVRDALAVIELVQPGQPVTFKVQAGNSTPQDVVVNTVALERAHLTTIGNTILTALLKVQGMVLPNGEGVRVANAPAPLNPDYSMTYKITEDGLEEDDTPRAIKLGDRIIQAGAISGDGEGSMWRARSPEELGIISRLILPTGWIAMLMQSGDEMYIVDNFISRLAIF